MDFFMDRMVGKKNQKKTHPLRTILLLIILIGIAFCIYQYMTFGKINFNFNFDFDIVKQKFAMIRKHRKYAFC
jgi:heme/copper-type cytochrome/quinol oxidase subunit 3